MIKFNFCLRSLLVLLCFLLFLYSIDMFSVAAIVAIITGSQVLAECDIKSGTGLALIGHAYLSLPVQDAHQCYEKCKSDEPKCRSLNYYGDSKFCDLNNVTRTSYPGDLKENPVSVYFESRYRGNNQ